MNKLAFWEGVAILVGTIIGAGVFTLPYAASQSGLMVALFWLLFLGLVVLYIHLIFGEIILRTPENFRLPGYVGYYLGEQAKKFLLITNFLTFGISLTIYLLLAARFMAILISPYQVPFQTLFLVLWFLLSIVILFDSSVASRLNFYCSFGLLALFLVLFFLLMPHFQAANFNWTSHLSWNWLLPYGLFLYALVGFSAVPEALKVARENNIKGSLFKKIILIASLIPVLAYALFILGIVGVTGSNTTIDAIGGLVNILGPHIIILGALLGFLSVVTSYLVIGTYLKHSFIFDYRWPRWLALALVVFGPLLVYLLGLTDIVKWLSLMGAVLTGFEAIMLLFSLKEAKKRNERPPEYSIKLSQPLFIFLVVVFVLGATFQIFFFR
jgi:tyrosine-specific transport protein